MKEIYSQIWGIALNYEQKSSSSFTLKHLKECDLFGARRQARSSGETGTGEKAKTGSCSESRERTAHETSNKEGQEAHA